MAIFTSVLLASILGMIYLVFAASKFPGIKKLAKENKKMQYLIAFLAIMLVFAVCCAAMSMVNAIIILLHVILFRLLFGLLAWIIKKCTGKESRFYWQGWLSLLACIIYLAIGYYLCHHVWIKEYKLKTDKDLGKLTIAMFADSHLGTTFGGEGMEKYVNDMMKSSPDILVIPGDYVDDGTKKEDMIKACEALGKLDLKYGVWFIFGNHDRGYFNNRDFSADELIAELEKNNINVLVDESVLVGDAFYIIGRDDAYVEGRKSMEELTKDLDKSKYMIVLDHQPNDYAAEAAAGADLVLSGHTHGGQLFPVTHVGEWIGANDRTYGYERRDKTDFVVTSGISDWEILFKTGTRSEYVILTVES